MRYDLVICEPGKNKSVCRFRNIIPSNEMPQIGEERRFYLSVKTRKDYFTSLNINVRIVRKKKGILFSDISGPTIKGGLQECGWCVVYAEPTAKNYTAGLKRLVTYANSLEV